MPYAAAVAHAVAADGTFSAQGALEWDKAHTVTYTGVVSGGILYGTSTTGQDYSLALAANSLVIGGGAGAAPFTSANLTFGPTAGLGLTIAAGTATTDVNALSITQTFNNAAVAFTTLKVNVTSTAANAASNLMDLQVGSATQFRVVKNGDLFMTGDLQMGSGSELKWGNTSTIFRPISGDGTMRMTNAARTDFNRLQFGGTTSSFPSIKRSTTTLQARLADDSAYATYDGKFAASGAAGVASGTFTTVDGKTATVTDGIITGLA